MQRPRATVRWPSTITDYEGQTMPTPKELERKLWNALSSDRTLMLGLNGVEDGHTRPMTALLDGDPCDGGRTSMWFFTIKGNAMVHQLDQGHRAIATFVD